LIARRVLFASMRERAEGIEMPLRLVLGDEPQNWPLVGVHARQCLVQPVKNNAQAPRAIDPPEPFNVLARTIPITH
jgi:hypothetical protein